MVGRQGRDERGQATVELAVVLPIAIIVAVIVVNALAFLGRRGIRPCPIYGSDGVFADAVRSGAAPRDIWHRVTADDSRSVDGGRCV